MQKSSTGREQLQDEEFEFPCSASFRDCFEEERAERRRRALGPFPRDSRDYELYDYIRELEGENFRLRVALDVVRLSLFKNQQPQKTPLQPASHGFTGIGEETR